MGGQLNLVVSNLRGNTSYYQSSISHYAAIIIQLSLLFLLGCLHDSANVQQTSRKCIQNTRANAGRLLDHVNIL